MRHTVLLLLLASGLCATAQSAFYRQCASRAEVAEAACLKNYRIDGIRVDITLVRAKDSAAFRHLLVEVGLADSCRRPALGLMLGLRSDGAPHLPPPMRHGRTSLKGVCLVGASEAELTIYMFHDLRTEKRLSKIVHHILRLHAKK